MRDTVVFTLNGQPYAIANPNPTDTVLDWLRYEARLTGTKEGCAEGDCGACTIVAHERTREGGVRARAMNACILFLPMIDGMDLITIEGVGAPGALHPVQTAMIEAHGSQCGFCTPGIVMALYAHHANEGRVDLSALNEALAGNLCRCTGYGPILEAARRASLEPTRPLEIAPPAPAEELATLVEKNGRIRRFFAPTSLGALCERAAQHPDATLVAGATDVGLWVTKEGRPLDTLISVTRVDELRVIEEGASTLTLGAAVRYGEAIPALERMHPAFGTYLRRIGAVQVRESGTIGGNIANGSPIGDMAPALIALGAEIELRHGARTRVVALEDFFMAYRRQDRAPGEVLTFIRVPRPAPDALFGLVKISKRFDQDISAVACAFHIRVSGGVIEQARLAFGGMAGVPKRARHAEDALEGRAWNETNAASACAALKDDFTPLSDHRASAEYRLRSAQGALMRFFQGQNAGAPPALEFL